MTLVIFVLLAVMHVNSGTSVSMHEFVGKDACERAASAVRQMADDVSFGGLDVRTWCVLKDSK